MQLKEYTYKDYLLFQKKGVEETNILLQILRKFVRRFISRGLDHGVLNVYAIFTSDSMFDRTNGHCSKQVLISCRQMSGKPILIQATCSYH